MSDTVFRTITLNGEIQCSAQVFYTATYEQADRSVGFSGGHEVTLTHCPAPPIADLFWAATAPDSAGDPCTGLGATEADALADLIDLLCADAEPSQAPAISVALERLAQLDTEMAAERFSWWSDGVAA